MFEGEFRVEKDVTEFRPISCCNTLYKCLTKVLCGRLRQILPDLILENQGGFVHGRFIVHNIMVVQDLEMLEQLEFPQHFVNLVMQCVSTPMFSLMFNGSMHGFFKSKRGLRQGDPISPLLFVICMEYLSRLLHKMSDMPLFGFHPRCREIKLTHLCFADDLILCCKGEYPSILLLLKTFKLFSVSSGLKANQQKSSIYCHGIHLVDKIVARIKIWSSKNLSYSARVQLINSVLLSLHIYWAQIYVLPKSVLQDIGRICRAFLWSGQAYSQKPSSVAWDNTCCGKQFGGLDFRDIILWNTAAMGKYVWALAIKQDNYKPPVAASWYWKQICKTKEHLKQFFTLSDFRDMTTYSVKQVYETIIGTKPRVHWDKVVWNRLNNPKHRFIGWLAMQSRLQTTSKLARTGVSQSAMCLICGQGDETHQHLFFQCVYSCDCIRAVKSWLGMSINSNSLTSLISQIGHSRWSKFKKQVYYAVLMAAVYLIWHCRNTSFWENYVPTVNHTVNMVKQVVRGRIHAVMPKSVSKRDSEWFMSL
ncbi:uncharacterized protein [Spinacia oleracea]|uniref:Reverse transcriptase domain-containing protein n=1 Tax=Spinacia oleracea TaxID=3562 RepID=A0ABM3RNZ8_SPIOL|nr:uncharacterized protein LOC130471310 [Spinacia oleracea]